MQKYAVGLEQIVWDQEDLQLEFRDQFKDTEYRLRTVSAPPPHPLRLRRITADLLQNYRNKLSKRVFTVSVGDVSLNVTCVNHVVVVVVVVVVANAMKKPALLSRVSSKSRARLNARLEDFHVRSTNHS